MCIHWPPDFKVSSHIYLHGDASSACAILPNQNHNQNHSGGRRKGAGKREDRRKGKGSTLPRLYSKAWSCGGGENKSRGLSRNSATCARMLEVAPTSGCCGDPSVQLTVRERWQRRQRKDPEWTSHQPHRHDLPTRQWCLEPSLFRHSEVQTAGRALYQGNRDVFNRFHQDSL